MRLVLATTNPGKLAELQSLLDADGTAIEVLPRPRELVIVEDATDFVGNARKKARGVAAATGEWALADDSGLEVDALDGAPGVRSARFAGDAATDAENVALLLRRLSELDAVGDPQRRARFRCVVVVASPNGTEHVVEGSVEGRIAPEPRGTGGFGYDPVFVPDDGDGRTFAEMTSAEKSSISHRGWAMRSMAPRLASIADPT